MWYWEYIKLYIERWIICHFGDLTDVVVAAVDVVDSIDVVDLITSGEAFGFKSIMN